MARGSRTAPPQEQDTEQEAATTSRLPSVRPAVSVAQPAVQVLPDEGVVVQVRVGTVDAVDLLRLAGAEPLVGVQAPGALQQPLPAQDLVDPGDAAGEAVRGVEDGRVGVGQL